MTDQHDTGTTSSVLDGDVGMYAGEGDSANVRDLLVDPTSELYPEFQHAYKYFNARLFEGCLPSVLITLQRNNTTEGYWSPNRFATKEGSMAGELAINPRYLAVRSLEEILSVLVHEQTHVWQTYFGKPGRRGYHNRQWADKMKSIGLYPSSTDAIGGDETGEQMGHYIIDGGPFSTVAIELIEQQKFAITWYDRFPAQPLKPIGRSNSSVQPKAAEGSNDFSVLERHHFAEVTTAPSTGECIGIQEVEQVDVEADACEEPIRPSARSVSEINRGGEPGTPANMFPALGLQIQSQEATKPKNRSKFICTKCKQAAWGKPSLQVSCTPCQLKMEEIKTNMHLNAENV